MMTSWYLKLSILMVYLKQEPVQTKECPIKVQSSKVPSNAECADGVIPANNGKFKNSKSTNLTNHIGNISEITDNVYQGYLNDGSDVLVLEVEHTDGNGVLETGTSSDEGRGLTEQKIKKGEKKISARLHTQRKASKVIRASIENKKKAGKQDEFHKEIKILYMVWINLIKYYLSGKISKHGIRVKTRNKIPKLQTYTEEHQPGGQTNLEVDIKFRNYGHIHQLQPGGQDCVWYGKPWTLECDSTLYNVISPVMQPV